MNRAPTIKLEQVEPWLRHIIVRVKCMDKECGWRGNISELVVLKEYEDESYGCPKCNSEFEYC